MIDMSYEIIALYHIWIIAHTGLGWAKHIG